MSCYLNQIWGTYIHRNVDPQAAPHGQPGIPHADRPPATLRPVLLTLCMLTDKRVVDMSTDRHCETQSRWGDRHRTRPTLDT